MQSVRLLIRQIGISNPELNIISEPELNEYIDYQFTSQGYDLHSQHYLGDVKDGNGNIQGYKFALWFVKPSEVVANYKNANTPDIASDTSAPKSAKVKI